MTFEANPKFQVRAMRASGVPITIAADLEDLYFQGQLAASDNFEPAVSVGAACLGEDSVVIDVGACLGIVSMAFARLVPNGRVVAVEANQSAVAGIEASVAAGGVGNVTVVPKAIGAVQGSTSYKENPQGAAWGYTSTEGGYDVEQTTIDDLVNSLGLDRVDLIKIDIEGNELAALAGAEQTLQRHRPVLVVELNPYCLWRFGRTLPQDLVSAMSDRYEFLWAVRPDASVQLLDSPDAIEGMLGQLGAAGGLIDLVASPRLLELASPLWAPTPPVSGTEDVPVAEVDRVRLWLKRRWG